MRGIGLVDELSRLPCLRVARQIRRRLRRRGRPLDPACSRKRAAASLREAFAPVGRIAAALRKAPLPTACGASGSAASRFCPLSARSIACGSPGNPKMAPQRLEKTKSAAGNGMAPEASQPQDVGRAPQGRSFPLPSAAVWERGSRERTDFRELRNSQAAAGFECAPSTTLRVVPLPRSANASRGRI